MENSYGNKIELKWHCLNDGGPLVDPYIIKDISGSLGEGEYFCAICGSPLYQMCEYGLEETGEEL